MATFILKHKLYTIRHNIVFKKYDTLFSVEHLKSHIVFIGYNDSKNRS